MFIPLLEEATFRGQILEKEVRRPDSLLMRPASQIFQLFIFEDAVISFLEQFICETPVRRLRFVRRAVQRRSSFCESSQYAVRSFFCETTQFAVLFVRRRPAGR